MVDDNGLPFTDLFRDAPMQTLMVTVVPIALAVAQLLNGIYTGFPMWAAVAFAAVMLVSGVPLAQHYRAEHRLTKLEQELRAQQAD